MMKQNLIKYLVLTLICILSLTVFSQDPLAPAVGVVEQNAGYVQNAANTVAAILIGLGFCLGIFLLSTGNSKGGYGIIGATVFIGAIVLLVINSL